MNEMNVPIGCGETPLTGSSIPSPSTLIPNCMNKMSAEIAHQAAVPTFALEQVRSSEDSASASGSGTNSSSTLISNGKNDESADLSIVRSTGAHEPDLSLEASTTTSSRSIRLTSRVAVQALQPHTPLFKKPQNMEEEEEELTVAVVTETHQDTRAATSSETKKGCIEIFNTIVWNRQDDQGVDRSISMLRCDEKPSTQQLEPVRRCCSRTCVHQNRSAKFFKIGSKIPTSRGNGASQSACSTKDASALSDVSKEQHCDGKCIFQKVSVGIVAKHDDSVIGDEDGTALSRHWQEDPSNRFLLSVGPPHATASMQHAISTAVHTANLAVEYDDQRRNPYLPMLHTRMTDPNDVYTLRSSRTDKQSSRMGVMDDSDDRIWSNNRSQSVANKFSDITEASADVFNQTLGQRKRVSGTPVQTLVDLERQLSLLDLGLTKAHRSCVDGDGATSNPMWTPWTAELSQQVTLDLSVHLLAEDLTTVAYNVTPDQLQSRMTAGEAPFTVLTDSPQNQQTPEKKQLLLVLGYDCPNCRMVAVGDVDHNNPMDSICTHCGETTKMTRSWVAKTAHPLIRAAQHQLSIQLQMESMIVKKLNFDHMSPVKGGRSEKFGQLLSNSVMVTAVVCPFCMSAQSPLNTMARQCSNCSSWLPFGATKYTIDPKLILDSTVSQLLKVSTPSTLQLVLASHGLTTSQQQAQELNKLTSYFPTYPMATVEEVTAARGCGLLLTAATVSIKFIKPELELINEMTALIGSESKIGYEIIKYLSVKTMTSRVDRFSQQNELVRALKKCRQLDLVEAVLNGKVILTEEESELKKGTSGMAASAVAGLVRSLLEVPAQWQGCRQTELHEVLAEREARETPSVMTIDPRILRQLDEALFRLLRQFMPPSFYTSLEDKFYDLKQGRVTSFSLLTMIFSEDQHSEALEAKDVRQQLDSVLSTTWKQGETATEFRRRYELNLRKYNEFSTMQRYPTGPEGAQEQIEHLLSMFKKGPLKTVVMNKWETSKLKAKAANQSDPDLADFWQLVSFQFSIIEAKEAREMASRVATVEEKPKLKRNLDESINSMDMDKTGGVCFYFTRSGSCRRGDDCPFLHDPARKKQKVAFEADTAEPTKSKPEVRGKGKGTGKGAGKDRKGGKQAAKGKGDSRTRTGKGEFMPNIGQDDESAAPWCSRCNAGHLGNVGRWCLRSPCRFCEETGLTPNDHHVRRCTVKPPDYYFVPDKPWSTPKGKGEKGSRTKFNTNLVTNPDETDKLNPLDVISSWTQNQFDAFKHTIKQLEAEMVVDKNEGATGEEIAALSVTPPHGATPRSVTMANSQLVAYVPPVVQKGISAIRKFNPDAKEQQLREAILKVRSLPGSHHVLVSLTQAEEEPKLAVPKRFPQLFKGNTKQLLDKEAGDSLLMLVCSDDSLDAMFGPRLTCCSDLGVRQSEIERFTINGQNTLSSHANPLCTMGSSPDDADLMSGGSQAVTSCCSETCATHLEIDNFSKSGPSPRMSSAVGKCSVVDSPDDASVLTDTSAESVALKEPKSLKAIQRIDDVVIREKWIAACKQEMQGLRDAESLSISSRAIERIYLKRLVDSLHHASRPPVARGPRTLVASDCAEHGHTPLFDDSAIEIPRAQQRVQLDLPPQAVLYTDTLAGDLKLEFVRGVDLCADTTTKPFDSRTILHGEQMDRVYEHRQEVLNQSHFRDQPAGGGKQQLMPKDSNTM